MRSLSRSRKAQFFILSAFSIVSLLYIVSNWIRPFSIIDTSSVVLMEEPFVFNNVKEKAIETVKISKDCEDLNYSLSEYKVFVERFGLEKNFVININYTIQSCTSMSATVNFNVISLKSTRMYMNSSFSVSDSF
jgi:hypothetical protein